MISLADRVKETSLSAGTGPLKLDGAALGFSSFGDYYSYNSTLFYAVTDGVDYEVGSGQYFLNGSDNSLSRYPFASSNSNNLVNFGQGVKEVFVTYPAKYSVFKQDGGILLENNCSIFTSGSDFAPIKFFVLVSGDPPETIKGTQIGSYSGQKLSFYGSNPVFQPATSGELNGFQQNIPVENSSNSIIYNQSVFSGNKGSTSYTINDIVKHLKNLGLIAE